MRTQWLGQPAIAARKAAATKGSDGEPDVGEGD
jgi:hypothetical protein